MNLTNNVTLFKWSFRQRPSKISIQHNQSIESSRNFLQTSLEIPNQGSSTSFPILEEKISKILSPSTVKQNLQFLETDIKQSTFLKNYNQKLKRKRKRDIKLKSSLNNLKYPIEMNKTIITSLDTKQKSRQNYKNSKFPSSFPSNFPPIQQKTEILVFKKSLLLDTSSHFFKIKRDHSNDKTIKMLLNEIYQMQNQKKDILQYTKRRLTIETQRNLQSKNTIVENYLSKFGTGFSLPCNKKSIFREDSSSKTNVNKKQGKCKLYKGKNQFVKGKYKKQLQKLQSSNYIDPWDFSKAREKKEEEQNIDLLEQLNTIS